MDRGGMELNGSHYAVLLHDRELRSTIARSGSPEAGEHGTGWQNVASPVVGLAVRLRTALAELRFAGIVRRPAN
jgi:hypothetical protein